MTTYVTGWPITSPPSQNSIQQPCLLNKWSLIGLNHTTMTVDTPLIVACQISKTVALITNFVRYAIFFMKALKTKTDAVTFTSTKDVVHATRGHPRLVTIGNGISLSVYATNVNTRRSGNTSAVSLSDGSHLRLMHFIGVIALSIGASLH